MENSDLLSGFETPKAMTVSDLNAAIRNTLEGAFEEVIVEGEISNYTRASSGHLYFTLKDEKSQIRCVMFRNKAMFMRFEPETGMKVIVRAHLSVYLPRGEYQLNVSLIEPAGIGALQLAFEQLKKKLEEEGLFDPAHKKTLPFLPGRLGIVTSPSGAAIRDILTVLERRYPNIHVTIYPTLVQGDEASSQIVEGINKLDEMGKFDVIIVTRGGGSMEDLWAFNEEKVARAIFNCRTPVMTAIGHEIDFTIADFVADVRAPTPSAAAELVVGRKDQLQESLKSLGRRMVNAVNNRAANIRTLLEASSIGRLISSLKKIYQTASQSTDDLARRLGFGIQTLSDKNKQRLAAIAAGLQALSPLNALKRGYSIATLKGKQKPLNSITGLTGDEELDLRLSDGALECSITSVKQEENFE